MGSLLRVGCGHTHTLTTKQLETYSDLQSCAPAVAGSLCNKTRHHNAPHREGRTTAGLNLHCLSASIISREKPILTHTCIACPSTRSQVFQNVCSCGQHQHKQCSTNSLAATQTHTLHTKNCYNDGNACASASRPSKPETVPGTGLPGCCCCMCGGHPSKARPEMGTHSETQSCSVFHTHQ